MANLLQRAESRKHLEIEQHKFLEPAHSSKPTLERWQQRFRREQFARKLTNIEFAEGRIRHKTGRG